MTADSSETDVRFLLGMRVCCRVVERMVTDGLIEEDDKPVVMRSLLLRHRHVHDDRFRFSISARKHSSYTSLQVRSVRRWTQHGASLRLALRRRNLGIAPFL